MVDLERAGLKDRGANRGDTRSGAERSPLAVRGTSWVNRIFVSNSPPSTLRTGSKVSVGDEVEVTKVRDGELG